MCFTHCMLFLREVLPEITLSEIFLKKKQYVNFFKNRVIMVKKKVKCADQNENFVTLSK